MKLKTINTLLGLVNLVLVVSVSDDDGPIRLWLERKSSYKRKTR